MRLFVLAIVVTFFVQLAKYFIPLLNGWGAFAFTVMLAAGFYYLCVGFEMSWRWWGMFLLVLFAAAGIHGTATKLSDHPHARDNPTPSGTPRQNYDKLV
jgi:hypothetical protein